MQITDKTGYLVDFRSVTDELDLMIINRSGVAIRMPMSSINVIGRATQGVKLINLSSRGDEIASVCSVASEEDEAERSLQKAEATEDGGVNIAPPVDSNEYSRENEPLEEEVIEKNQEENEFWIWTKKALKLLSEKVPNDKEGILLRTRS